jgi:hypothetical protein
MVVDVDTFEPGRCAAVRALDAGPLGTTLRGWDSRQRRGFTCLRLAPRLLADEAEWRDARDRLRRVVGLSVRGVARVLGVCEPPSVAYAAVDGPRLLDLVRARAAAGRRLTWPELALVVGPVAEAVDALPIAHGLIGPRTIRLTAEGPCLTHYGLGHAIPTRSLAIAHLGEPAPSVAFGPEHWAAGYRAGRAGDLFALAGLVADLWGGPDARARLPERPTEPFLRVLAEGLRPEPAHRPRSARAWFAALQARAAGRPPAMDPDDDARKSSPIATRALNAPGDSALHPR